MNEARAGVLYEKRKNAVAAVQRGESVAVISRTHGVPRSTVFAWLARYRAGGWDELREGQRSGRPRKLTGKMIGWLYEAITLGNPQQFQFPFCLWTLNIIRMVLKKRWGVSLSKSAVSRLLGQLGLTPQRPFPYIVLINKTPKSWSAT